MYTKYKDSPIVSLYKLLNQGINNVIKGEPMSSEWEDINDDILEQILLNNGCSVSEVEGVEKKSVTFEMVPDGVYLILIKGWMGNEVNEFYDVIECFGCYHLIVFMDAFLPMYTEFPDEDDDSIAAIANRNMGNSPYYDAICKIVTVFCQITYNPALLSQSLATTAAAGNFRYAPSIIAINILNDIREITQNDIPDIPIEEAKGYLNDSISVALSLSGIRKMNTEKE